MDIIYLNDLRIDTIIGIYDWERRVKQTISLDLEMAVFAAMVDRMDREIGRVARRCRNCIAKDLLGTPHWCLS